LDADHPANRVPFARRSTLDRHLYLLPQGTSAMITVNSKGSEIVLIDEPTSPAA